MASSEGGGQWYAFTVEQQRDALTGKRKKKRKYLGRIDQDASPSERALELLVSGDADDFTDEQADALNAAVAYVNGKIARGEELTQADQQVRELDLSTAIGGNNDDDS